MKIVGLDPYDKKKVGKCSLTARKDSEEIQADMVV